MGGYVMTNYMFEYSAEPCTSGLPDRYVFHVNLLCAVTKDVLMEHEQPVRLPEGFLTRTSEDSFLMLNAFLKVMEVQTRSAWNNALASL